MRKLMRNRKAMAWVVLLTFLFSCVMPTGTVFADSDGNNNQIDTLYYLYGADGALSDGQANSKVFYDKDGNILADASSINDNDAYVSTSKTITPTEKENEFDITLEVETKQDVSKVKASSDAAVVVVFDASRSMSYGLDVNSSDAVECAYGCKKICDITTNWQEQYIIAEECTFGCAGSRLAAANKALEQFVADYTNSGLTHAYFSMVTFNNPNYKDNPTADSSQANIPSSTGILVDWHDISNQQIASDTYNVAKKDLYVGTATADGLAIAKSLLEDTTVAGIENKYIILLTDGAANEVDSEDYVVDDGELKNTLGEDVYSEIRSNSNLGDITKRGKLLQATYRAKLIHNLSDTDLYVIALSMAQNNTSAAETSVNEKNGVGEIKSNVDWLKKYIAEKGEYFFNANNASDLNNTFSELAEIIRTAAVAYTANDPMGDYVEFVQWNDGAVAGSNGVAWNEGSKQINWDLKKAAPTTQADGIYKYKLSYRVRLDNTKDNFDFDKRYATNGETKLTYVYSEEDTNGNLVPVGKEKVVDFRIPQVKGYTGNLIFKKVNASTEEPISGVEFTLTSNCQNHNHVEKIFTAKSDDDGFVTFANIPSGHTYTLTETTPVGYAEKAPMEVTVAYGVVSDELGNVIDDNYVIENKPITTDLTVTKVWVDNDNQDGKRPNEITVNLLADGKETGKTLVLKETDKTLVLKETDEWTGKFTGLVKLEAGQEIVYTVEEVAVNGYTSEITGDAAKGYTITNTYTPETIEVKGTKTWDDNNNQDGKRPESITVNLLADGQLIDSKTVTESDNWAYSFDNLPKYNQGKEIAYTITEDAVTEYTPKYEGHNITNTHTPDKTSVTVVKAWKDNNDQDGIRPNDITVKLLADGKETGETLTLDAENSWRGIFTELDKFESGQEIVYTVEEVAVDGYTSAITGDAVTGYTITNTHTPEITSVSGEKIWVDNNNRDNTRPENITVKLFADGVEVDSREVSTTNQWRYEFTDLPGYKDGNVINYTVEEVAVPDYESEVIETLDGFDIVNTLKTNRTLATGDLVVRKQVTGDNAPDDANPYHFTLEANVKLPDFIPLTADEAQELHRKNVAVIQAEADLDEANASLTEAERAFRNSVIATTESAYEYVLYQDDYAVRALTSGSVYEYHASIDEINDGGAETGIVDMLVEFFKGFAANVEATAEDALLAVVGNVENTSGSAIAFDMDDASDLFNAQKDVTTKQSIFFEMDEALDDFMAAVGLNQKKIKLNDDEIDLTTDAVKNEDGSYTVTQVFSLKANESKGFTFEATSGSAITFMVTENAVGYADYEGVAIYEHGITTNDAGEQTWAKGQLVNGAMGEITSGSAVGFTFINMFTNKDNTTTPPGDPVIPPPGDNNDPPEVIDDPEPPLADVPEEVEIVEPGVPLADAPEEEEIFEEEIPLGDAPPTGDANNAIPFAVLMMAAAIGLVITRKRFN